ncbi:YihY/virulence factor BrkB family protein [Corynebacterium aquatimens]|uniref:Membrane protein n=1 Tax=Corynebacterium aquatimens TaxID=1190508 RepID=A0A931E0L6_9CORY|nr:YihY/virulence factor BrkB family protein [Corynebacterium aquatimens]MBG6121181.1 membrane protein [Corynebacterium aquatimens]WJY66265.1 Ribonuclease BN-like family protein [Corynebacterium aquatimens]
MADHVEREDEELQRVSHAAAMVQPYGPGEIGVATPKDIGGNPFERSNRVSWNGWKLVIARTIADFGPTAITDRGATLTYFTFTAFAPVLLAFYSLVTLLLPRDSARVQVSVLDAIARWVPEPLQDQAFSLFMTVAGTPSQSTIALIISIAISLWSASAYVRSFARSANAIYGRMEGRGLVRTWLTMWGITLLMVVGGVVILASAVLRENVIEMVLRPVAKPLNLEDLLEYLTNAFLPVWEWVRFPVGAIAVVSLVSCLYYFAPNVRPGRYRVLTIGAAFALVVIIAMWWIFGFYISTFGIRSAYGAFGTFLAVVVVLWVMNIVLLLGVKIDAEILRVKELQLGYPSREMIQAEPKAHDAVLFQRKVRRYIYKLTDRVVSGEKTSGEPIDSSA